MNKRLFALALLATPSLASADTILGLYAGVGQWYLTLDGEVSDGRYTVNLEELGIEDETSTELWVNFEHPIPLIPNIRLMHTTVKINEKSAANRDFRFGDASFDVTMTVTTDMDLSHTDATLYYEILDNWVTLDVGVTARYLDGYVDIRPEFGGERNSVALSGVIPMLYLNAQLDLPFTGWNVGAYGNSASYRGDSITDLAAKVGYEFELTPLLDIGVNLGYRIMSLKTEELDDLMADAELSGMFAELQVHF